MGRIESKKLEIFKLHGQGKSVKDISIIINCSKDAIYGFLKRHNRRNTIKSKSRGKRSEINKRFVYEYLKNHNCTDCENSDTRVLEFDHVRGIKLGNITQMARNGCEISKLLDEIDKCEIRCCNCHRIVTIERRKTNKIIE